jgi:Dolichyl-phosphate-mannose-protein mannosyltransferase
MGGAAAILCGLALVDPRLGSLAWAALALAAGSLIRDRRRVFAPVLALCLLVPCWTGFSIGADSLSYMAYPSSILADRDLDFANQLERLEFSPRGRTPTGLTPNALSVGPGLVFMPAMVLTDLWLTWTGGATDPFFLSAPYYSAAAATTILLVLAGAWLLAASLSGRFGRSEASVAVLTVIFASPLLFYVFVEPLMSHGLTFAFVAGCLVGTFRAERERTLRSWAVCGALLGLAMLCRAQSAPLGLVIIAGLWRARAGVKEGLTAGGATAVVFAPQLVVFKVLYGSFLIIPQGDAFIEWTGAHIFDVLFSADKGLFNWHPLLLFGLLGLMVAMRGLGAYAVASLGVFAFTTYLNGSLVDWHGSAAFGGRRFDVVLPLLAVGLAGLLARATPVLRRRPLLLPAAALVLASFWNVSLIDGVSGRPATALPLDDLGALQARQARRVVDGTLGRLGSGGRDLAYRAFVGLFTYHNYRPGGDFDLATLEPRFMRGGWSELRAWDDGTLFRYLLYPRACIVIPLDEPFDLRGFVLARSPARIKDQRLTLTLNDRILTEAPLGAVWTEIPFQAARGLWRRGENEFCMVAALKRPGDEGDDQAFAAAVMKVQLP